ncbi:MAG: TrmB family transcriptional regulator [Candidatus Saccharibacteria bacterium]
MERTLINSLSLLGCSQKHIKFYQAAFELGSAPLIEIAKKARLQRSTAYLIASELIEMGLVSENHRAYKKQFVAAEPDYVLQKLEAKYRQLGRNNISFKEALPELRAEHQSPLTRPRVRTFSGRAGLVSVWKDILSEQQEILLWTNQEVERKFFGEDTHDLFIKERVRKSIPTRVLAVDNPRARNLHASDNQNLRQTRVLPLSATFTSETYIYGNKVAILDIGKDIFGVIAESKQIADSHRNIFELTWGSRVDETGKRDHHSVI